ncbi:MAG: hypothetical protein RBR85_01520 [Bacilli bacterium]|nr:hypothetical protein [Bacilli bacterium]
MMETKIEAQEYGIALVFGLMKFSPKELFHHAALLATHDSILVFDDETIDLVDDKSQINYHNARFAIKLKEIGFATDEKLIGRKDLRGFHRFTISVENGDSILIFFYPKKSKKAAKELLAHLRRFKIEVAKSKSDISF